MRVGIRAIISLQSYEWAQLWPKRLMETENLFVASTVFLEAGWVLRRVYGLKSQAILTSFRKLAGLPQLIMEDPHALIEALDWMEAGMDFADALHLTKAYGSEAFMTFDQKLVKTTGQLNTPRVRSLT